MVTSHFSIMISIHILLGGKYKPPLPLAPLKLPQTMTDSQCLIVREALLYQCAAEQNWLGRNKEPHNIGYFGMELPCINLFSWINSSYWMYWYPLSIVPIMMSEISSGSCFHQILIFAIKTIYFIATGSQKVVFFCGDCA